MQKRKQTPIHNHFFIVDYSTTDWDEVLAAMLGRFIAPVMVPILILVSKLSGRRILLMKYFTGKFEEDLETSYDKALDKMNKDK